MKNLKKAFLAFNFSRTGSGPIFILLCCLFSFDAVSEKKIVDEKTKEILEPVSGIIDPEPPKQTTESKPLTPQQEKLKKAKKKKKKKKFPPKPKVLTFSQDQWAFYLGRRYSFSIPASPLIRQDSELIRIYKALDAIENAATSLRKQSGKDLFLIPWKVVKVKNDRLIFQHTAGNYLYFSNTNKVSDSDLLAMAANEISHSFLGHRLKHAAPFPEKFKETEWPQVSEELWKRYIQKADEAYNAQEEFSANLLALRLLEISQSRGELNQPTAPSEIMTSWLGHLAEKQKITSSLGPYERKHPGADWQKEHLIRRIKTNSMGL